MIGSRRAYERRRGLAHGAVYRAVRSGRLERAIQPDGSLDFDLADQELAENTIPQARIDSPSHNGHGNRQSLLCSRAAREALTARLLELEYRRKAAGLVRSADVVLAARKSAARARALIATIPDRIGLPPHSREALEAELARVCDELSRPPSFARPAGG